MSDQKPKTALQNMKANTIDVVEKKIAEFKENGELHFPDNYSPQNALKSAWLTLQETQDRNKRPVLEACTKESIANALLYTVVQGLSPAKNQVYYIAFGNQLKALRSYMGTMAVTKRLKNVIDITAQVIYEGDEFEYAIKDGTKVVTKHAQMLLNIDIKKIVGAYCILTYQRADGQKQYTEVMTMDQIRKAWERGEMKGNSPAHRDHPEEMAKKTVIGRTCKLFVNTSDDSDLLIEAFNKTSYVEDGDIEEEIEANANSEVIEMGTDEYISKDEAEPAKPKTVLNDETKKKLAEESRKQQERYQSKAKPEEAIPEQDKLDF